MAHADILDQTEQLKGSFLGSVVMHIAIGSFLIVYGVMSSSSHVHWGSKNGGGMGSVALSISPIIPMQQRPGPVNPVANDTKSEVPTAPSKAKPAAKTQTKAKAPEPDAVVLKGKKSTSKKSKDDAEVRQTPQENSASINKWREQQKDALNQLYGKAGQAMNSPMIGKAGSGQLGMGNGSPFGEQLGWYANLLQDRISQHWRTDDIPAQIRTAPQVIILFTLRRDGSVPGLPQIKQSSGIAAFDRSAQRAVMDSSPFPAIPAQFPRNEAQVEFTFELRR